MGPGKHLVSEQTQAVSQVTKANEMVPVHISITAGYKKVQKGLQLKTNSGDKGLEQLHT